MKRLLCFLLSVFLLQGCENKKEVENKTPDYYGFRTNINTTINDVKISAGVEYESFDKLVLTFYLPESVSGMKIVLENEQYTLTYDELVFSLSKNSVPFSMVCEMVRVCAENVKSASVENEIYTFSSNGHIYKLSMDESNCFKKLIVDETYTIDFENFEYVMGQTE
ncbi:MAG: hypothetical protein IKV25_03085 [Clostridia bacterium]|nr:hypothetical protein [Clostridia bacterium]